MQDKQATTHKRFSALQLIIFRFAIPDRYRSWRRHPASRFGSLPWRGVGATLIALSWFVGVPAFYAQAAPSVSSSPTLHTGVPGAAEDVAPPLMLERVIVSGEETDVPATVAAGDIYAPAVTDAKPYKLFVPFQAQEHPVRLSTRLGFGLQDPRQLNRYPLQSSLRAGWYHNWILRGNPDRPDGIEFVQTVRLHQDLECPVGTDFDRERCPYVVPHSYTVRANLRFVQQAARHAPGSIWLIGNEMDRVDWGRPSFGSLGHQDEMLPELYAEAYHDLYWYIKARDPRAKIAIGGIIQPTPLRMEYLTKVWDAYLEKYGVEMPVDVWNTHNFILREGRNSDWGAGVPPGSSVETGAYLDARDDSGNRTYHLDLDIFDQQIRTFRAWMKERGQQEKPLIVSEYGVLYSNHTIFPNGLHANNDPRPTIDFMLDTFDYFLNERDCELGFVADDCRLVQAWNWFVFNSDDRAQHGRLFEGDTGNITPAGEAFREYSLRNLDALAEPYPIP